ncbi:cupin domain-containing protein [Akkermansia sp.]
MDGTAYFTIGNAEADLSQGEALMIPAGVPHSVIARERFKMLVTSILPLD